MYQFIIRFSLFILFWVLMMHTSSSQLIVILLMLTTSLIFFFFLSKQNTSIYIYYILALLIFIHGLWIEDFLYSSLLLLLIATIAIFRLSKRDIYILLGVHFSFSIILAFLEREKMVVVLFIWGFFIFLAIKLYKMIELVQQQEATNTRILIQYRQLKRNHVATEEAAKAEERTRIAREIHDSVGHRLTALIMKLEMLHIQDPNENYVELKEMANASLDETREAVQALQVSETKGIAAVVQLIRKLEAESQLLVQFTMKEGVLSIPLSNEHGVILYRVIQEALTNVMRHSTSKHVQITLGKSAIHTLTFSITNRIVVQEKFALGFGLKNMKAREEESGGK